jgi:hypothetical protein
MDIYTDKGVYNDTIYPALTWYKCLPASNLLNQTKVVGQQSEPRSIRETTSRVYGKL